MKTKEQLRSERLWKQMLEKSFDPSDWYQREDDPKPQRRTDVQRERENHLLKSDRYDSNR